MFDNELLLIRNVQIRKIAEDGIKLIPDYFWHVPASSSGKYHPSYALGEGGLYRHVQAAVGIAAQLFRIHDFSCDSEDLIIASLILHDGWKQGFDGAGKTLHEHPLIAADVLMKGIETEYFGYLAIICANIRSHMGQWTTSPNSDFILPEPETTMQRFVHLCDYLTSRKSLEYNFKAEE